MTDIVERLRAGHAACAAVDDGFWTPLANVLDDAAAEIERLRAEVERLHAALRKLQYPDGRRDEEVAEWLRGLGYAVTAP